MYVNMAHSHNQHQNFDLRLQEMANPLVREQLKFYPERTADSIDNCRQGERWNNADPQLACPMVRKTSVSATNGSESWQDFFVYEPCLAIVDTALSPIIPVKFYESLGIMYAEARSLRVDCHDQWIVMPGIFEVPIADLRLSFDRLSKFHAEYRLPRLTQIHCMPITAPLLNFDHST